MVRFGRGFPLSSVRHLFGATDFVETIIDLGPDGRQVMSIQLRAFASVDINDGEQSVVDILAPGAMSIQLRAFSAAEVEEDPELSQLLMSIQLRNFSVLIVSQQRGWAGRNPNRKNEKERRHPWKRLGDFVDTTSQVGVDFAPIISQFGFWRVSDTLRDTITLRETATISADADSEGRP